MPSSGSGFPREQYLPLLAEGYPPVLLEMMPGKHMYRVVLGDRIVWGAYKNGWKTVRCFVVYNPKASSRRLIGCLTGICEMLVKRDLKTPEVTAALMDMHDNEAFCTVLHTARNAHKRV